MYFLINAYVCLHVHDCKYGHLISDTWFVLTWNIFSIFARTAYTLVYRAMYVNIKMCRISIPITIPTNYLVFFVQFQRHIAQT